MRHLPVHLNARDHKAHKACVSCGIVVCAIMAALFPHLEVPALIVAVITNLLWVWGE